MSVALPGLLVILQYTIGSQLGFLAIAKAIENKEVRRLRFA